MPFIYKEKRNTQGSGGGLPGSVVDGALVVGKNGGVAALANGAPGEVLSISDTGKLGWTSVQATGEIAINKLTVPDGDEWILVAGGAVK